MQKIILEKIIISDNLNILKQKNESKFNYNLKRLILSIKHLLKK